MGVENLRPVRSKEEASKKGRLGGVASGKARRKKKQLRECLEILIEREINGMTTADAISTALVEKALTGDTKAFEIIRDTLGQKPVDKQSTEISGGLSITWEK